MIHKVITRAFAATLTFIACCGEALSSSEGSTLASARGTPDYRDGTYTAEGLYGNLPSKLTITLQLVGNRIQDVSVRTHATDPTSLDYQRRFAAAVPALVKGKPIAEVQVGKLAGSSATPDGFNAALKRIRDQAARP